jgi:hypothetical protein
MATSKQPKQPPFPHPPLEQGVAQYPTPLVPNYTDKTGGWSINEQGHIILVEKVSIEKGSFNPQPLDGSVTYTGRDANKWPSTLYLVAEKPTPEGEFIYRYWANDRSLSSQNLWNYGIEYSSNNPNFPITSRTYIVPRSQYSAISLGTSDPVFGGDQKIAQQKMMELPEDSPLYSRYVAVQMIYESIPGPVITGARLDPRGDVETVHIQTVPAGTAPFADGLLVTETKVDAVDSVKSTKTTATVQSYATLTTNGNKSGLLGLTSTTDDIVAPATNPDALSTTVLESSVEAISATKSRKRTTTSTGPTSLSSDENKSGLLGITETVESIVAAGAAPDSLSTTILQSTVTAIDSAKSKKTTTTASGPTSLSGKSTKAGLLGNATTTESIVAAGADADALSLSVIQSAITPIDAAKSKKTTVTASGPTSLTAKKISERGDTQIITKSIVDASASVTTDSLLLVSSQVDEIDSAKSQKTDVTVASYSTLTTKSKKAGLLGDTSTTDDIVSPSTTPDELSATVLESSVEQITATKARKRTTTASGPTSLSGQGKKGGLLGLTTTTESIVVAGANPDDLSLTVLASEVTPIDAAKSKKTTTTSSAPTQLDGSQYDEFFKSTLNLTEQVVAYDATPLTDTSDGYGGGANGYLLSSKDDPIDLTKKKRTIVSASALPPQRVEYKTAGYSTPQLIFSLAVDSFAISTPDIRYRITPVTRAAQSRLTMQRITTSFTYGPPSAPNPSDILSPELKRVAYTGYNSNFDLGDALCDTLISYNVGTSITLQNINALILAGYFQGNITIPVYEHIDIPATSISASTYNSYVNTWKITSFEQEYYKAGIWVSRQVETYII